MKASLHGLQHRLTNRDVLFPFFAKGEGWASPEDLGDTVAVWYDYTLYWPRGWPALGGENIERVNVPFLGREFAGLDARGEAHEAIGREAARRLGRPWIQKASRVSSSGPRETRQSVGIPEVAK